MKTILLIEDNFDIRENISEILQLANFNVLAAENGKIGVELAQEKKPDLIICDIMMPVLDGHGVLHMLSRNDETASIPFIFLTARSERIDYRKGMEMGADDYLTKPFDDIELLNAIESRFKKSEILKREFSKNIEGINAFMAQAKGIESLKELSKEGEIKIFKKKEDIYREGSFPKGIYFINKGKVKTYQSNDNGKEFITELYNEGDFFGYLSLLKEEKYTDTATALEEAEVYIIPRDDFFALIYKNQEVSKKFIQLLSDNLIENEKQLLKLAYDSVRRRVAQALVKLSDKYKKQDDQDFSMYVSREDLANLVGTATETVIRTLSEFKDDKYIEISSGNIKIINYEKLANLKH